MSKQIKIETKLYETEEEIEKEYNWLLTEMAKGFAYFVRETETTQEFIHNELNTYIIVKINEKTNEIEWIKEF